METYRLYEWSCFSGRIPEGSTLDIAKVHSDDNIPHDCGKTIISIDPVLLSELQVYYTCTDPDYRNLLNRYKKEEAEAHLTHHLNNGLQWKGSP